MGRGIKHTYKTGLVILILTSIFLISCENLVLDTVKDKVNIFTGNVPVISLKYEGITIRHGDTIPALVNSYVGNPDSLNFSIENHGENVLNLNGNPFITIEPTINFNIETGNEPSTNILPDDNTSFIVTFNPDSVGTKLALLTIFSDDPENGQYQIMLSATATLTPEPEIYVTQGSTVLTSGSSIYDVGNVNVDGILGSRVSTTFTIKNIGSDQLLIGGVTRSGLDELDYSLSDTTISPLAVNASTTFDLEFDPLSIASGKTVDISISSDDNDEDPFTFTITGNGTQWTGPSCWASNRTFGERVEVGWNAQTYAERYDIYRSTSWYGTYTKIGEALTNSFTDTINTPGYPCLLTQGYVYKIMSVRLLSTTPVSSEPGAGAYGERTGYYHFLGAWGGYGTGNGQFDGASGIDYDSSGNFYVSQDGHYIDASYVHRVQKLNSSGSYMTDWGSKGTGDGQFMYAMGIAVGSISSVDHVYVADTGNHRIQRFSTDGTFEGWLGYDGSSVGWHAPGSGMTGTSGSIDGAFNSPADVDCHSNYLIVSDSGNHRIQIFMLDTNSFLKSIGSYGSGDQQFNSPQGIATDTNFVYVADKNNHRIQKIHSYNGTVITRWGSYGSGDSQFYSPEAVALSTDSDYLYVGETGAARIKKFDNPSPTSYIPSTYVSEFGTYGTGSSEFHTIGDIIIGADETIYVCEYWNNYIERFKWE